MALGGVYTVSQQKDGSAAMKSSVKLRFLLAFSFAFWLFLKKYKLMNDFITVPERKRYWFPVLKIRTGFCLNSQTLLDHFSRVLVITIIPTHIPCQIAL